jgi:hypothetical protein
VMPTKPVVTSHWNYHYQRRFDKLAELAAAGDWDAVAAYERGPRGRPGKAAGEMDRPQMAGSCPAGRKSD